MKVLHVTATPRGEKSRARQLALGFIDALSESRPDVVVETLDTFEHSLPAVAGDNINAKYSLMAGQALDDRHAASWRAIEALIEQFLSADAYVVSCPMWNLGVP